jgi:hypothetical protein
MKSGSPIAIPDARRSPRSSTSPGPTGNRRGPRSPTSPSRSASARRRWG